MNDETKTSEATSERADSAGATPEPASGEHDTTAKEELFEAIDHFKAAAAKLFDRAARAPALKQVSHKVDEVAKKVEQSPPLKKVEELADKLDPTFDSAAKEAERVITKIGATAEPLARQLSEELGKLTKRITEQLGDLASRGRSGASGPEDEREEPQDG